jgi:hypothetical protein
MTMDIDVSAEDLAAARRLLAAGMQCLDDQRLDWTPLSDAVDAELAIRSVEPENLLRLVGCRSRLRAAYECPESSDARSPSGLGKAPSLRLLE